VAWGKAIDGFAWQVPLSSPLKKGPRTRRWDSGGQPSSLRNFSCGLPLRYLSVECILLSLICFLRICGGFYEASFSIHGKMSSTNC
jgi:hypothetical protein